MVKRFADEPSDKASERLRQFEEARGDIPPLENDKDGDTPKEKKQDKNPAKKSKPSPKNK